MKLPESLLDRLEQASSEKGCSKGSLIRQALEKILTEETSHLERIAEATESMKKNKKPRRKIDWSLLRQKLSGKTRMSPEEEVIRHRRRSL
ncbi:MAG: hypothetical protein HYT77_05430 [Deltaproteobacteria bacterium]|nr:hypothetical protein [Deltaproteobacteria bacterium]